MLKGDRFCGSPASIESRRAKGWVWRLRSKYDSLAFDLSGGETRPHEYFARGEHVLTDVEQTEMRERTNMAMLHEDGHPEPWIIALSDPPTAWRAQDYGMHWGVETMFSDDNTRGFNLEDSRIDRTDWPILVMSLAVY
jgi:hypothetical protein